MIAGALLAYFKYMENACSESLIAAEKESARLVELEKPYLLMPWEKDWGDEPPQEGDVFTPEAKPDLTATQREELIAILQLQQIALNREELAAKDLTSYESTADFWALAFMVFSIPIAIPYLIWPLVIAGRWVWRGNTK
ncbi:MAG: hypothetical protein ABJL54_16120 [Halioglobus sp.]